MRNFFVSGPLEVSQTFTITGELMHYINNVLRFKIGMELNLLDGTGNSFQGRIIQITKNNIEIYLDKKEILATEPSFKVDLFQALPKGDRFDYVLEKNCEIGINSITPIFTKRTIKTFPQNQMANKVNRWEKILINAAQQSGRGMVPLIHTPLPLNDLNNIVPHYGLPLVAWEHSQNNLKTILTNYRNPNKAMVIIGPEGGFADEEIDCLKEWGALDFSLGPRILRSDTAGLIATTILLYHYGAMEV